MKILVPNIGSTSFKFRLFEITGGGERELAAGSADRIGGEGGVLKLGLAGKAETSRAVSFADHASAIRAVLDRLAEAGVLDRRGGLDAVAFKAVVGGELPAVTMVDEHVLAEMERLAPVAPAHNPPYVAAMRLFAKVLPAVPLVACFEMGFHRSNPPRRRTYAVGGNWAECGVRRYGYHGASHRYIAWRVGQLQPEARRVISCHLGGSSSMCAIRAGESVATSMGLSPQSGLPQGNRVGDFDVFGVKLMMGSTGRSFDELLEELGSRSGLAGLSGTSGDMRDIQRAAATGDERARLALEVFTTAVRDYLGAYLVELGGAEAIVFAGGIGENNPNLRADICRHLAFAGIALDAAKNESAAGEARIDAAGSKTAIWVMPTNEELIVARQAAEMLTRPSSGSGPGSS